MTGMFMVGLILLALGLFLFVLGRFGVWVNHHPFCRNCGFDLFKLPLDRARCPECGHDILADNTVRIGRQMRMTGPTVVGVGLMLAGVGLMTAGFGRWWGQFDGAAFKPQSWLMTDVASSDADLRRRSSAEIVRRLHAGTIIDANPIADVILKLQADPLVSWHGSWGDVIQAAREGAREGSRREITDERWQRYLAQGIHIGVLVRPRVSMDYAVPVELVCDWRYGAEMNAIAPMTVEPQLQITAGGRTSQVPGLSAANADSIPAPLHWDALWTPEWTANGSQTLDLAAVITLHDRLGAEAVTRQTARTTLTVLARGQSSVLVRPHPELLDDMRKAIHLRTTSGSDGLVAIDRMGHAGKVWISGAPIAAAFRVSLFQPPATAADTQPEEARSVPKIPAQWTLARLLVRPNDANMIPLNLGALGENNRPQDGPAEIVFTPEPLLAAGTVDVLEVWSDEIRLPVTLVVAPH